MKNLRHFCAVTILLLALAVSAFAGQVDCPGVVDPPPDTTPTVTGQVGCSGLTEAAVSLIQSVLSLT
jgi:hypothetical protein